MSIDRQFLINALLQHNFLPNQKRQRDELPPVISSRSFSESVAMKLVTCQDKPRKPSFGYDAVKYKLTRFNGVARVMSIPHPKAYAGLALSIADNWPRLSYIADSKTSKIIPRNHRDGRIVVMDYGNRLVKARTPLTLSFGRQFMVRTDISNCYPSIYSHSVPWAAVGIDVAKQNAADSKKWYNKLDRALRLTKRNETNGIAIGPGTSNIVSELILARVDSTLRDQYGYVHIRYIDDYTAYCTTYEEAEQFILHLADELAKYELLLNVGKTDIRPLPQVVNGDWVIDLNNALPRRGKVSPNGALNFLEFAILLADKMPDGSVLRYALSSLMNAMSYGTSGSRRKVVAIVLRYTIYLSFHRPILIPLLDRLFNESVALEGKFLYADEVRTLINEHVRLGHSDALAWMLYFASKYGVQIDDECSSSIVLLEDCVPLLMLYLTNLQRDQNRIIQFAKNLDANDLYGLDRYWLLLYQLFFDSRIGNPYGPGTSFDIMKAGGVSFVVSPALTRTYRRRPAARGMRRGGKPGRRPSRGMRKSV